MREYAKKPKNQSRTLDSNPKASRQAPISEILQAYRDKTLGKPIQRQSIDEDEELLQGKFDTVQREAIDEEELLQGKFESDSATELAPVQQEEKPNNTGLPDNLKTGIENLSGYSMDDVKVHYNSDKPAQLNALAYAQGTDIHVAPGQEKHLPHEAWHVVQQKQGRVQPTMQMQGVNINDNERLEKEADNKEKEVNISITQSSTHSNVIQGVWEDNGEFQKWDETIFELNIFKKEVSFYYSESPDGAKIIFPNNSKFNFISQFVENNGESTSKFFNEGQLTYVIKGSLISSGEGGATYCAIMYNENLDNPKDICIKVPIENYQKEKEGHELLVGNTGSHLMKVYGFNDDKGLIYIEKMQTSNPLDPKNEQIPSKDELIKLKTDMFSALDELQNSKIIHGDIHLSNIMKGTDGNYKLIDFGETKRMPTEQNAYETNMYFQNSIQILYSVYQAALYYKIRKASTIDSSQDIMKEYYSKRIAEREDYLKTQNITIDISERYKEIRTTLSTIQTSLKQKRNGELTEKINQGNELVKEAKNLIQTFIQEME